MEPVNEQLIATIETNEHVTKVEQDGNRLRVYCRQDISVEIAAAIVNRGARLTHLSRKDYGLDEIYHRYFEGGS